MSLKSVPAPRTSAASSNHLNDLRRHELCLVGHKANCVIAICPNAIGRKRIYRILEIDSLGQTNLLERLPPPTRTAATTTPT